MKSSYPIRSCSTCSRYSAFRITFMICSCSSRLIWSFLWNVCSLFVWTDQPAPSLKHSSKQLHQKPWITAPNYPAPTPALSFIHLQSFFTVFCILYWNNRAWNQSIKFGTQYLTFPNWTQTLSLINLLILRDSEYCIVSRKVFSGLLAICDDILLMMKIRNVSNTENNIWRYSFASYNERCGREFSSGYEAMVKHINLD